MWSSWFKEIKTSVIESLDLAEEAIKEADVVEKTAKETKAKIVEIRELMSRYTKLARAHNKLREDHDVLQSRFDALRDVHNGMAKKVGALESDLRLLERRFGRLVDPQPLADTSKFLDDLDSGKDS